MERKVEESPESIKNTIYELMFPWRTGTLGFGKAKDREAYQSEVNTFLFSELKSNVTKEKITEIVTAKTMLWRGRTDQITQVVDRCIDYMAKAGIALGKTPGTAPTAASSTAALTPAATMETKTTETKTTPVAIPTKKVVEAKNTIILSPTPSTTPLIDASSLPFSADTKASSKNQYRAEDLRIVMTSILATFTPDTKTHQTALALQTELVEEKEILITVSSAPAISINQETLLYLWLTLARIETQRAIFNNSTEKEEKMTAAQRAQVIADDFEKNRDATIREQDPENKIGKSITKRIKTMREFLLANTPALSLCDGAASTAVKVKATDSGNTSVVSPSSALTQDGPAKKAPTPIVTASEHPPAKKEPDPTWTPPPPIATVVSSSEAPKAEVKALVSPTPTVGSSPAPVPLLPPAPTSSTAAVAIALPPQTPLYADEKQSAFLQIVSNTMKKIIEKDPSKLEAVHKIYYQVPFVKRTKTNEGPERDKNATTSLMDEILTEKAPLHEMLRQERLMFGEGGVKDGVQHILDECKTQGIVLTKSRA